MGQVPSPLIERAGLDTIAEELRSQYSIGCYPNRPAKDGKWHSVRIRVKNPDYSARAARNTSTSNYTKSHQRGRCRGPPIPGNRNGPATI
jgi:hypothetical protein